MLKVYQSIEIIQDGFCLTEVRELLHILCVPCASVMTARHDGALSHDVQIGMHGLVSALRLSHDAGDNHQRGSTVLKRLKQRLVFPCDHLSHCKEGLNSLKTRILHQKAIKSAAHASRWMSSIPLHNLVSGFLSQCLRAAQASEASFQAPPSPRAWSEGKE